MTTSAEYEKKAQIEIDHIDQVGIKAIETARLYTNLAIAAAIRESGSSLGQNKTSLLTERTE
jgi:hypothetical protein